MNNFALVERTAAFTHDEIVDAFMKAIQVARVWANVTRLAWQFRAAGHGNSPDIEYPICCEIFNQKVGVHPSRQDVKEPSRLFDNIIFGFTPLKPLRVTSENHQELGGTMMQWIVSTRRQTYGLEGYDPLYDQGVIPVSAIVVGSRNNLDYAGDREQVVTGIVDYLDEDYPPGHMDKAQTLSLSQFQMDFPEGLALTGDPGAMYAQERDVVSSLVTKHNVCVYKPDPKYC